MKKRVADLRRRVDLDPGDGAGQVGDRPRQQRHPGRAAARAATRCASSACTPAQLVRISKVETPCAAGSRSRAAATSARISANGAPDHGAKKGRDM